MAKYTYKKHSPGHTGYKYIHGFMGLISKSKDALEKFVSFKRLKQTNRFLLKAIVSTTLSLCYSVVMLNVQHN